MAAAVGVHVGNVSACLAVCAGASGGAATGGVVANDAGDRVTQAVLALNGHEWEVGLAACAGRARGKGAVTANKRLLDLAWTDADLACVEAVSSCGVRADDERVVKYEFASDEGSAFVTPDDIATKLYGKLFTIASHAVRADADLKLVLAAPLEWSLESRQRLARCAELAGFDVAQVIGEPSAALLAYGFDERPDAEDAHVLVYRLGGTSCDATLVKVAGGFFSVKKHVRRSHLGGKCLTEDLADYIAQEFAQKWKLDPRESRKAMAKLFQHADTCKHVLSTLGSAHVFIESLMDGFDWSQNVTRARFENIISSKLSAYMEPIRAVLNEFENKIDKVVLCGGSMKIPKLQSAVSALLPEAEVLCRISPDEVIAEGCAKQAGYLLDLPDLHLDEMHTEIDFLSKSIYAKYLDKSVCLFPEGTPILSETTHDLDLADNVKTLQVALHEDLNADSISVETFEIESYTNPIKLKATLQQDNILLKVC